MMFGLYMKYLLFFIVLVIIFGKIIMIFNNIVVYNYKKFVIYKLIYQKYLNNIKIIKFEF